MSFSCPKGVVVGGTHSGSGKTTVTLGLLAALKKRGVSLAPFKVGPDFIDPGHHRQITGKQSRNLDGWMLSESENRKIFTKGIADADMAVVEGVMGLFDGYDGRSEAGSTAQMSKWLNLEILLVVNARSMARSAAAVVFGFTQFDPGCRFCGVVFNNVASSRHMNYLRQAVESTTSLPVLGGLPKNADLQIPGRHLGLVTAEDHAFTKEREASLAKFIEENLDLDALIDRLPDIIVEDVGSAENEKKADGGRKLFSVPGNNKVRIGVARDNAFCFYYPDNFELLEKFGARIVFFSPVHDRTVPEGLDGLYLGGGYPELHADRLSKNISMRKSILKICRDGMPVYAECGGFMYLCEKLIIKEGGIYDMVGCFPFTSRMKSRLAALGYRKIRLSYKTPLGEKGLAARGHEFHYSCMEKIHSTEKVSRVYEATDRSGADRDCPGYLVNQCLGSYVHLHFGSCPAMAENFVSACSTYQTERKEKGNASF